MAADGILGLGFDHLSDGYYVFVDQLQRQGQIEEALFSVYMGDNEYSQTAVTDPPSNIMIGGYDLEKYSIETEFTYVDVVDIDTMGYWTVDLS
jgi:hypothetical protein